MKLVFCYGQPDIFNVIWSVDFQLKHADGQTPFIL